MAIVKSLPGFEVTIVANGKPLSEYVDNSEPDQDRKTIRYIEAISDQVFEIHVKAEKGANTKGDGLAALIYVDGQSVVQPILRKDHFDSGEYMTVCQGKEISEEKVRPFCFALIDTAQDNRAFKGEEDKLKELGSIRVELNFIRVFAPMDNAWRAEEAQDLGIVSKKALTPQGRPISHSVVYKSAAKTSPVETWDSAYLDPSGSSTCSIVFHYASKTSLRYAGIIPRTPSPPPLEDKEDPTREEVKQLQAQIKELKRKQAEQDKIKQESETENKAKRRRKVAQTNAGVTQFVLGEDGAFTEQSTAHLESPKEAQIEILSDDET